eukprot:1775440-Pleurochrysis_carterae.AAC.4
MRASRSSPVGGGDKSHSKSVLTVHGSSDLGMAGALDVSASRDARPLEVKDVAYSGLLARVHGSPDPRAMRASRSSKGEGGDRGHSESAPAVHGSSGLSMADALDVSFPRGARQSNEKEKVLADPPPPEMYVKVALSVEEDGTALLILSSSESEGRAEKESVESTPHSPAEPIRIGGSDYVQAGCEAGENKEAEALEFMVNGLPSLSPSPPPMHMDEGHGELGRAGSSQLTEGART